MLRHGVRLTLLSRGMQTPPAVVAGTARLLIHSGEPAGCLLFLEQRPVNPWTSNCNRERLPKPAACWPLLLCNWRTCEYLLWLGSLLGLTQCPRQAVLILLLASVWLKCLTFHFQSQFVAHVSTRDLLLAHVLKAHFYCS